MTMATAKTLLFKELYGYNSTSFNLSNLANFFCNRILKDWTKNRKKKKKENLVVFWQVNVLERLPYKTPWNQWEDFTTWMGRTVVFFIKPISFNSPCRGCRHCFRRISTSPHRTNTFLKHWTIVTPVWYYKAKKVHQHHLHQANFSYQS